MNDTTRIRFHSSSSGTHSLASTESRLQRERGQQEGAPPAYVYGTVKFDAFAASLCFFFFFRFSFLFLFFFPQLHLRSFQDPSRIVRTKRNKKKNKGESSKGEKHFKIRMG